MRRLMPKEKTKDEIIDDLKRENAFLRVKCQALGCTYGFDISNGCPLGYPGCSCADDLIALTYYQLGDEGKTASRLAGRLNKVAAELKELKNDT